MFSPSTVYKRRSDPDLSEESQRSEGMPAWKYSMDTQAVFSGRRKGLGTGGGLAPLLPTASEMANCLLQLVQQPS